ncbi:hypothetical protein PXH59_18970 [Xenorhabdus sp. SF857]|uniref:hypothetical protein n=1 Tax=Xenorhabdus bakwenae TaxID=3026967 RepID=UPI00255809E3|nr:hypothetical protein [Xenorhabdus sp. SF857]WFQ79600.1 hypothetical protein PXH59_18970 [Xenorhabdus sp. SF857]
MALSSYFKTKPAPEYSEPKLEENEFSTNPGQWRVKKENGKYIFKCLSGTLAGGECITEITEEECDELLNGKISSYEICLKYNIG